MENRWHVLCEVDDTVAEYRWPLNQLSIYRSSLPQQTFFGRSIQTQQSSRFDKRNFCVRRMLQHLSYVFGPPQKWKTGLPSKWVGEVRSEQQRECFKLLRHRPTVLLIEITVNETFRSSILRGWFSFSLLHNSSCCVFRTFFFQALHAR